MRSYRRFSEETPLGIADGPSFPTVMPGFDNTPRSGSGGVVLHGAEPHIFESNVARAAAHVISTQPVGQPILFVKSWNEWAEGNYLEPDRRYESRVSRSLSQRDRAGDEHANPSAALCSEATPSLAAR